MVKLTKEQRVKNIRHNRKFGITNNDRAINYGGKCVKKKPTLDDYDNITLEGEDNQHDIDFGLDNYNNKED
jgi:hypothetical protein